MNDLIDRISQNEADNVIPYVWGGSSFLEPYQQGCFYTKDGVWHRQGKNDPYTGYDCSEFIMRMAKIVGINFPWKTTTSIQHGLAQFTSKDILQAGDIIWVEGHTMIISDIEMKLLKRVDIAQVMNAYIA
ncbi:MAG: C40 family peptidase [Candidatus Babeliaceae bacterium]|nr:C40 family peptidase [Candidatus Babeliaceae bacterium]